MCQDELEDDSDLERSMALVSMFRIPARLLLVVDDTADSHCQSEEASWLNKTVRPRKEGSRAPELT